MKRAGICGAIAVLIALGGLVGSADAQAHKPTRNKRPFEDMNLARPAVSPYLNLLNSQSTGITNYQTLVKPQVQQLATARRQGAQINQLQKQVAARPTSGTQGSESLRPTGHHSTYQNFSHFYPSLQK